MPGRFFDSNVLLYVMSRDVAKAERAEEIVAQGGTISVQVLNEMTNVARRKMRMSWNEVYDFLGMIRALLDVVPMSVQTHDEGLAVAERYGFSTYDAMIVASAKISGCSTLWSEDMQHDLLIGGGLRIVNPFQGD